MLFDKILTLLVCQMPYHLPLGKRKRNQGSNNIFWSYRKFSPPKKKKKERKKEKKRKEET